MKRKEKKKVPYRGKQLQPLPHDIYEVTRRIGIIEEASYKLFCCGGEFDHSEMFNYTKFYFFLCT